MQRLNIPVIALIGIVTLGIAGAYASIWFNQNVDDNEPTPSINRMITATPAPTLALSITAKPTATPRPVQTVTPIPTPTVSDRPSVAPNPTATPLPQSFTIGLTVTTEHFKDPDTGKSKTIVYICPPTANQTELVNLEKETETSLQNFDDEYVACTAPYEDEILSCIDNCGANLICMTGCEQSHIDDFQACKDEYNTKKQPVVDNATNILSATCSQQ